MVRSLLAAETFIQVFDQSNRKRLRNQQEVREKEYEI